ncbi:hypothetical protein ENKO_527c [Klebsiella phage fENko-Kae01]|nr:hypothetical protein [Klebsiella phage fENko-Kae01]
MIPFARILDYGNTLPDAKIVQFCGLNYFALYIDSIGNLFALGDNSQGQLGTGDSAPLSEWRLIAGNIKKVVCATDMSVIIQGNDGQYYISGNRTCLGLNSNVYSFTKLPFTIPSDAYNITATLNNMAYLIPNSTDRTYGDLYMVGRNSTYSLSNKVALNGMLSVPTLMVSRVKDVQLYNGITAYRKWFSAYDVICGFGNAPSMLGTSPTPNEVQVASAPRTSNISWSLMPSAVMSINQSWIYGAGLGTYYCMGNGSTAQIGITGLYSMVGANKFFNHPYSILTRYGTFFSVNNDLYCTGNNTSGQLGLGNKVTPQNKTIINLPDELVLNDIIGICANSTNTMIITRNTIWYSGSSFPSLSQDTTTFTKLSLGAEVDIKSIN